MVTVAINLRQEMATQLDGLAKELGLELSDVCRMIISLSAQQGSELDSYKSAFARALASLSGAVGKNHNEGAREGTGASSDWIKRSISLDRHQLRVVTDLADANGHSLSRTLRDLVAAVLATASTTAPSPAPPRSQPGITRSRSNASLTNSQGSRRRRRSRRTHKPKTPFRKRWQFAAAVSAMALAGAFFMVDVTPQGRSPEVLQSAPWAGSTNEIIFDHHSHSQASDGQLSAAELFRLARNGGCDAIAITDRSDGAWTVEEQQLKQFRELRKSYPGYLLFGGVELNMPSYGNREHANVIVDPEIEAELLPLLRAAAEQDFDPNRELQGDYDADETLLQLAADSHYRGEKLVMVYNHPSRKDTDPEENYRDITNWNAKAPLFIGFAGAPGHQKETEPGGYHPPNQTIDRWDPVVAQVGGTWDRLLAEGHQLWGAMAGSNYHSDSRDKVPCNFARTHITAAERTYTSVLDALRVGTFWADHGQILRRLTFSAQVTGLTTPVFPGSIVALNGDDRGIVARVSFRRGPGSSDSTLHVEFIGNCRSGEIEMLAAKPVDRLRSSASLTIQSPKIGADEKSCFVRARVRRELDDEPDLMAYTNPIRFVLR